ncbi:MAG: Lrp/AsnC family transcriptional regulator [Candidatus Altiarchaeota archaeon]|nr:Lrp/AsnC family transcriptional regulator [Candidatus Altiarchaeota archaeon]
MDLGIINALQKDGRASFREIAEGLKVAEGTVYNRVNKLQEVGVIKGFLPNIDFTKLGYDLAAIIGIIVEGGHLQEIEKEIGKSSNVSAVYDVTGEFDAIIVAKFKDRETLNAFVKSLLAMPDVKRTNTMMVLNIMKEVHGVEI